MRSSYLFYLFKLNVLLFVCSRKFMFVNLIKGIEVTAFIKQG